MHRIPVLAAAFLAGFAMTVHAAETKPAPPSGPFSNQFQQMSRTLKLTEEQKTKIRPLVDAMNAELENFKQAAVKKSRDAIAVIESKDGAERDKLRAQLAEEQKKAVADYQNLIVTHQEGILSGLTSEQRLTWETHKLAIAIMPRLGGELTESQRKEVHQLIDAAAKELVAVKDSAAILSINGKLVRKLVTGVLTEEQAARLFNAGLPSLSGLGSIPGPKATPIDRDLP
jgi:Spy/CpxP family protein refolding chaperone